MAAFYQQIPEEHVEIGLRTHNLYSPWPEEMNRHSSATALSGKNLFDEGAEKRIR